MKHKFSINRLAFAFASVLSCAVFSSCDRSQPYIITYKSVLMDKPAFSQYYYSQSGWNNYGIIDSTNRYNIGDDVRVVK